MHAIQVRQKNYIVELWLLEHPKCVLPPNGIEMEEKIPQCSQKGAKSEPEERKGIKMEPKGSEMEPKGSEMGPEATKMEPEAIKMEPKGAKREPKGNQSA